MRHVPLQPSTHETGHSEGLNGIEKTAWLTTYCHDCCGDAWGLNRPVSSWLIERFGLPPFAGELSFFTRHGIAGRAKWIDDRLGEALRTLRHANESAEIWVLGAGFDSRWQWVLDGYDDVVTAYREFDLIGLLAVKDVLIGASPWRELWSQVDRHAGDLLSGLPEALPGTDGRVLVVLEGLLDYFDEVQKRSLFEAIRVRAPHASIYLDAQDAWLLSVNNKRSKCSTGDDDVTYAWAPADPATFYGRSLGFGIAAKHGLLPDLIRRKWPLLRAVPLPKRLYNAYSLMVLQPSEGA